MNDFAYIPSPATLNSIDAEKDFRVKVPQASNKCSICDKVSKAECGCINCTCCKSLY